MLCLIFLSKILSSFLLCPHTHFSLFNKHVKFFHPLCSLSTSTSSAKYIKTSSAIFSTTWIVSSFFKDITDIYCFHMQVKFSVSQFSTLPFPHHIIPNLSACLHFFLNSTSRLFPWMGSRAHYSLQITLTSPGTHSWQLEWKGFYVNEVSHYFQVLQRTAIVK